MFRSTLLSSLTEQLNEIESNIRSIDEDGVDIEMDEGKVADVMSSLVASLLYLFLVDKIKFRSFRNRRLRCTTNNDKINLIFSQIVSLTTEMNTCFTNHDITLAWRGLQIVPIIRRIPIPSQLR